jgi:multidrug efflux pump subunit AcrA (membrane-fusion protein)
MAAEVTFTFGADDGRSRTWVPAVAVGEDRSGRFVFVAVPSGDGLAKTSRCPVTIGDLTEEGIEVLEGLSDGDLIVTAGVTRIQDDQTVRLLQ